MRSVFVIEKTLDSMWYRLLYEVYHNGRVNNIDAGSYAGTKRLEFDYVAGTIEYPQTRPLAPIMPEGVPPVTTDEDIEKYFINYIMDGHNLEGNEHYRYATWVTGGPYTMPKFCFDLPTQKNCMWKKFKVNVPNQLQWAIDHYKSKGFGNNHCYIQVGYPESSFSYDMPFKDETDRMTSPCLRGIDTHIKDGRLHFAVVFRSWDLYGAWPENMGGITMLQEFMAAELGIEAGPISFSCLKLHCYDFQIQAVRARLNIDGQKISLEKI